ncbi:hypothetical protein ES676_08075 [Bizionia saleffrena]|uniref:Uncharacterized protein n=1 Tax=Bizionia saleffrena TaxID=291189 RepID=A0A8H2QJ81_9FLAO|nr:hypothetical protein [Bizionia saleffrena]TYB74131.1 hypothetical protein ES676_08075 [Bizionia saleffrena]
MAFEYKRNHIENTEDDNYQEFVYIELQNTLENVTLENSNLQDVKVTFVKLCYCKGQMGAYKVKNGKLQISKLEASTYHLELSFKVTEVSQIINSITRKFSIAN